MAIHVRTDQRPQTIRMPALAAPDDFSSAARALVAFVGIGILIMAALLSGWPSPSSAPTPVIERAVAASLNDGALDAPTRLLRTEMTAWGDLNIEFALRDRSAAPGYRVAALADVLAVVQAVYEAPEPRPINVTLIGVWRDGSSSEYVPALYASMPADKLVGRDWAGLRADDLATVGVVRWLSTGVCPAWGECGPAFG